MAANSWWERANEIGVQNSRRTSDFAVPAPYTETAMPTDFGSFRRDFGDGFATQDDYKNWKEEKKQDRKLSDFVSTYGGNVGQFEGRLNSYLDMASPVASDVNRFESGLSSNEARLNALLEDPESIKQTAAYKFRLKQGEDAIQRQMGAKGLLNSGNRLMELTKYGQDMGSQEYDAQAGRLKDLVGTYSGAWIGDKNANTARYAAESDAWNKRGGLLGDLYGNASRNRIYAAQAFSNLDKPKTYNTTYGMNAMQQSPLSHIGGSTPYSMPTESAGTVAPTFNWWKQ